MTKNERRILNDSIKIKLNTLVELRRISKMEVLNEALDRSLAIQKVLKDVRKLGVYVKDEKIVAYPHLEKMERDKKNKREYYLQHKDALYARQKERRELKKEEREKGEMAA
jgi:hypothetical protein